MHIFWPLPTPGFLCMEFQRTKVYRQKINSLGELKESIHLAVQEIIAEMLQNLFHNAKDRFEICRGTDMLKTFNKVLTQDL